MKTYVLLELGVGTPGDVPPMPVHLRVGARRYWRSVAPALAQKGLLTPLTADALALVCMWWHVWTLAAVLKATAAGRSVMAEAAEEFRRCGRPFGLKSPYLVLRGGRGS